MKFTVKNTKTPEQILLEKQINNQVVYIHTRKDKPGHVFYVGEGKPERPYSKNRNSYWHNIVKTHGYNVHIIKTNLTVEESQALEVKLTLAYKSIGMAEASIQIGGNGNKIVSDETRLKLSIINKGRKHSDEIKKKFSIAKQNISDETRFKMSIAAKGHIVSDETRKKLSIAAKNRIVSDETRLKLSISKKNMSDETRLKMSDAQKGRIVSNETRLKLSIAAKNRIVRIVSDETRLKMSISKKNMSDETRLKLSIAAKNRCSKPVQAYIGEEIISNFNSAKDAELITGISNSGINRVCNNILKTSGIYDLKNQKFVSLTPAQLKESPNCKRVSWRFI